MDDDQIIATASARCSRDGECGLEQLTFHKRSDLTNRVVAKCELLGCAHSSAYDQSRELGRAVGLVEPICPKQRPRM